MIDYMEKQQTNHLNALQQIQMTTQAGHGSASQLLQLQSQYPASQPSQSQPLGQQMLIDVQANQQLQQQPANNELIGYYFGSISRETSEWILKNHGNCTDGAYLLRSSGPNDSFVLSLMVVHGIGQQAVQTQSASQLSQANLEVLHYKIVETEDSFVALHGQVGDEKFATIDELIEKAQGVATKPRWPILRQSLESQILPPTYWGLTVDQVRLAILIKAKQWGFPLTSIFQQQSAAQAEQIGYDLSASSNCGASSIIDGINEPNGAIGSNNQNNNVTPLNNETIRTLIYKSLHEFQPWFHGKISRDEAERRVEEGQPRDGRFLVRERDNYSYAMCISHKRTTKHYRIDVIPTGELAIQDGRKFTSLMALVSHYTIMSDGLWCALTEACPRPIQPSEGINRQVPNRPNVLTSIAQNNNNNLYCVPPPLGPNGFQAPPSTLSYPSHDFLSMAKHQTNNRAQGKNENSNGKQLLGMVCPSQNGTVQLKAPIKEWLQNINNKWTQLMSAKSQHQSLNSFLFGSSNPLNNHCRHSRRGHHHHHNHHHHHHNHNHSQPNDTQRRKSKNAQVSCGVCSSRHQMVPINGATLPTNGRRSNGASNLQVTRQQENGIQQTRNTSCKGCKVPATKQTAIGGEQVTNCLPHQQSFDLSCNNMHAQANGNGVFMSHLAPNSGFSMNGHSFIGSPLFAVKATAQQGREALTALVGQHSGSGSSGNSNSENRNNIGEEKLISPAQSVASNLNNNNNNPYNLGSDIYRSPASTAIVNDQQMIPTSSSSSSGNQPIFRPPQTRPCGPMIGPTKQTMNSNKYPTSQQQQQQQQPIHHAGPIMCGQHAGPAYRYTNCNANDSFGSCTHHTMMRPLGPIRAADDSLLLSPSTQLAGPAAMAKFVQFQDGQCLRTHRDTKSIQMAYLSSLRQPPNGPGQQKYNNQVPNVNCQTISYNQGGNFVGNSRNNPQTCNTSMMANCRPSGPANHQQEVDLIDCNGDGFDFKYDPKMIKSSSIETLCGAGETEQEEEDSLDKYKNNQELVMSLQSCWMNNSQQVSDILHPVPVYQEQQYHQPSMEENNISLVVACNEPNCQQVECRNSASGRQEEEQLNGGLLTDFISPANDKAEQYDDYLKKTHGLDELTTSLLAKLTEDLKAQVDLKNKRSGFCTSLHDNTSNINSNNNGKQSNQQQIATEYQASRRAEEQQVQQLRGRQQPAETNPRELINEFDTLVRSPNE